MSIERYVFIDAEQTFFEARSYCRNHHSDLASVRNHTENSRIQEAVPKRQQAWLGLHRGSWIWWSDNAPYLFGNWAEGHPLNINNSCAASVINATHPGKWVEKPCHEKLNFMCYNGESISPLRIALIMWQHISNHRYILIYFYSILSLILFHYQIRRSCLRSS